jgi:hypothetical protein
MKVKLKRLRYVLDWFEIDDIEIATDDFAFFKMQFRCGNWFLMHFVADKGKVKNAYGHDFQLSDPWEAVLKLEGKIKAFESLHGSCVSRHVANLMQNAEKAKEITTPTDTAGSVS